MIYFVDAGPGATDLLTVRADKLLRLADVIICASPAANAAILALAKRDCAIRGTANLSHDEVSHLLTAPNTEDHTVIYLYCGNTGICDNVRAQIDFLMNRDVGFEIVSGTGMPAVLNRNLQPNPPTYSPRFPLFVSMEKQPVLIVGGGIIAARRMRVLAGFGSSITVLSPVLCSELEASSFRFTYIQGRYPQNMLLPLNAYRMVLAATDNRAINCDIGKAATALGVPVSVADSAEESSFWFPAIAQTDHIVAGITSTNGDHSLVKQTADNIRRLLEETTCQM